uniref:Thyrotropin subunit beta n=1 Tax=Leptobrachium leishanense TaxID=445787 RepID=A0A8C5LPA9_9ANUR
MRAFFTGSVVLYTAFGLAVSLCLLTEYTIFVEKKECAFCIAVNTTSCTGYCISWDPNMKEGRTKSLSHNQNVCTYDEYIYNTITIPGCPWSVNPLYTYPVAITCKCGKCDTEYSDCTQEIGKTNYCTKPKKPNYIEISNYIQ